MFTDMAKPVLVAMYPVLDCQGVKLLVIKKLWASEFTCISLKMIELCRKLLTIKVHVSKKYLAVRLESKVDPCKSLYLSLDKDHVWQLVVSD